MNMKEWLKVRKVDIARDNERLSTASDKEKRLMIARDILAQLAIRRLVATHGSYVIDSMSGIDVNDPKAPEMLHDVVLQSEECWVCALGAAYVVAVERFNGVSLEDHKDLGTKYDVLCRNGFDRASLDAIEATFEGWGWDAFFAEDLEYAPQARMRLVWENVVANDGTLQTSIKPVYEGGQWVTPGYKG